MLKVVLTPAAFLAAVLLSAGCRSQPKPEPKSDPVAVAWRPVGTWSGSGNSQTESFPIETGQFRLKWETSNEKPPGTGMFRVMVHSAVSGRPLMLAVEHAGVGHDTAYVSDDPRIFHLVIDSSNVDWALTVEEAVVGDSPRVK